MGRELNHGDVRELLGAYALDAVEEDERRSVEEHLETCSECKAEVAQHREVAGVLSAGWLPAPEGVWDRISGSLEEAPPPMRSPVVVSLDDRRAARRPAWSGVGRAAAAAGVAASIGVIALLGVLGVKVIDTSEQVDDVAAALRGDVAAVARAAANDPRARTVALRSPDGAQSARVVLLPDGSGYLVDTNLPRLPNNRTYQLWAVHGSTTVSVGVLGPAPEPLAFRAAGDVTALAITEEVAGGVVATREQPRVLGTVTPA